MADEQYDLALVQGEDYVRRFRYRYPPVDPEDEDEVAVYLDFATVTDIDSQIRAREYFKATLILDLVAGSHLAVDEDDSEYLLLHIPGDATTTLEPKLFAKAAWDLFVELAGGARARLLQGAVTIDPAATAVS